MRQKRIRFKETLTNEANNKTNSFHKGYYDHFFKGKNRVRIRYKEYEQGTGIKHTKNPPLPYYIVTTLENQGYQIDQNNMAYLPDNPNNRFRIGRLLNTLHRQGKFGYYQFQTLREQYERYSRDMAYVRDIPQQLQVIISKQPYDIATMSTNKQ